MELEDNGLIQMNLAAISEQTCQERMKIQPKNLNLHPLPSSNVS